MKNLRNDGRLNKFLRSISCFYYCNKNNQRSIVDFSVDTKLSIHCSYKTTLTILSSLVISVISYLDPHKIPSDAYHLRKCIGII